MQSMIVAVCFFAVCGMTFAVSECYHAWSEVIPDKICSKAADCGDPSADCIFSIVTNSHVCCKPKSGAILPICPEGKKMLSVGKNSGVVCTNSDQCPDGFSCFESITNFDKFLGQENKICCQ